MKRFTSALLALMLPAVLLTGCGGDTAPAADTPMETAGGEARPETAGLSPEAELNDAAMDAAPAEEPIFAGEAAMAEGAAMFSVDKDAEKTADDPLAPEPIIRDDDDDIPPVEIEKQPQADALMLTAGEWNDNDNWGFFSNLVKNETIAFPAYGLDPCRRVAVKCECNGQPVRNATVTLYEDDNPVWIAQSGTDGMAYLFFGESESAELSVEAEGTGRVAVERAMLGNQQGGGKSVSQTACTLTLTKEPDQYKYTQVMFILDTTGSMGDEIAYLQKDFSAIAEEVAGENVQFSVNFYRDSEDDYVTKCNPFSTDVKALQALLNQEYADGGGDEPEAVAQILSETMTDDVWGDATNKIAFLIFDAPPHYGTENELQKAIRQAADIGVRLVPVVASNSSRETELFGRAAAIMTGANYVFLTDDSGIGESHLEPIIGDYDVELLHDIIVRNIQETAG